MANKWVIKIDSQDTKKQKFINRIREAISNIKNQYKNKTDCHVNIKQHITNFLRNLVNNKEIDDLIYIDVQSKSMRFGIVNKKISNKVINFRGDLE